MSDPAILALIAATFLVAGTVKGVIGLGLPTVSLALLTVTIGLHPAMAMLLVPSLVTNLWQAAVGGQFVQILRRLWPFLLAATVTVWIGATALSRIDANWLSALLGTLVVIYSVISLTRPAISIPQSSERWAGIGLGAVNGVFTGMTGSFVFPGVLYLQAMGLARDTLVQAMGILFTVSTVALAVALGGQNLLTAEIGITSTGAVVPALIGMVVGQRLRQRLSEQVFRKVFFSALLLLGAYIVIRSLI